MSMGKFYSSLRVSLKRENIIVRQKANDGTWVSFLLPVAVIITAWKSEEISPLYISSSIYSLNLLLNVFHLLYHIFKNQSLYVTKRINIICAIPSSISMYLYVNSLNCDVRQSFYYTIANTLIYFEGLPFLLKVFPNSFTFGEANLAIQGLSLFLFSTFVRLNNIFLSSITYDELNASTTILQIGHLGVLILCIMPFICQSLRYAFNMYLWIIVVVFGFISTSIQFSLGENPFIWLWKFLTKKERVSILLLWLLCSFFAGLACWHRVKIKKQATTIVRKYFHVLADIVFISGIVLDLNLIYFASGCVLAIFILFEILRIMKIPPFDEFLRNSFLLYADEKDSGILALTPLYLLIGYSFPIWIHPHTFTSNKKYLSLLSGVLCVGIGDTCASIVGKSFGKRTWKGSNKTMEGTLASIICQFIFILIFANFGYISNSVLEYSKILMAVIIPSLVEAFTDQIDNIVLPLITYTLLMM